ncbi:hypothetical protein N2152v2_010971 [Parachlorella kessleri]
MSLSHCGWSPWFGATLASPTDATQGQTCPCGTWVTQWRVWQAVGKVTLVGDKDPLNGIVAVCSNGAVLDVLPGLSGPGTAIGSPTGFQGVSGKFGRFLDSMYGLGGTGPTDYSFACQAGNRVLGFQVVTEAAAGAAVAKRVRVFCGSTTTCPGT